MYSGRLGSNPFFQNAAHRRAPNVHAAGDCGFARARTVELPYLVSVEGPLLPGGPGVGRLGGRGPCRRGLVPGESPFRTRRFAEKSKTPMTRSARLCKATATKQRC